MQLLAKEGVPNEDMVKELDKLSAQIKSALLECDRLLDVPYKKKAEPAVFQK